MLNLIPKPQIIRENNKPFFKAPVSECRLCMPYEDTRIQRAIGRAWSEITIDTIKGDEMYISLNGNMNEVPDKVRQILSEHDDSYYISLEENGAYVFSLCTVGLFYGIVTLKQIFENNDTINCCEIIDYSDIKIRSGYFDLRQCFPKFENLISYIEMMAEFKLNTLMIEYEDKFPFEKHSALKHNKYAFTDEQLRRILDTAQQSFIEIIPIQQSFGHLEYVLKHERHKELREMPEALGELCPSNPNSLRLACELIDEMAEKHFDSRYIHLGCDEVWSLGSCNICMERYGGDKGKVFIDFVNKLISHVCDLGKTPIIWHDMLGHCSEAEIARLDNRAAVMIWLYEAAGIHKPILELTMLFRKYGIEVFGACAVRSNDGLDTQNHPKIESRIKNIDAWTITAKELGIPFIAATNWSAGFSMGTPYGIYETSIYPMCYFGERAWNQGSEANTFLKRFLKVFHGIDNIDATGGGDNPSYEHSYIPNALETCGNEDYYALMQQISKRAIRHRDIADLIEKVKTFDDLVRDFNSASSYLYRYRMFGKQEVELLSLRNRAKSKMDSFFDFCSVLKTTLEYFLEEDMAEMYIASRYFVPEMVYNEIYKKMLYNTEI